MDWRSSRACYDIAFRLFFAAFLVYLLIRKFVVDSRLARFAVQLFFCVSLVLSEACSETSSGGRLKLGVHIAETELLTYVQRVEKSAALGLRVIRIPVDWNVLEPKSGHYSAEYVSEIQARLMAAQALGVQAVMMFAQSPPWANGGNHPAFPPEAKYYQSFADALKYVHSALIGPRDAHAIGSDSVLAWEVWNEPNVVEFWPNHGVRAGAFVLVELAAAKQYAALLDVSYRTMKSAYPELTLLGGSLAAGDTAYLQALYTHWGGIPKFDHLSLHPYARVDESPGAHYGKAQYPEQCNSGDSLSPPWCFKLGIENIRAVLNAHGDAHKQIWLTEFGTSSAEGWGHAGGEAEQREHLRRSMDILRDWRAQGDTMAIPVAISYRLQDEGGDRFGLYRADGGAKPIVGEIKQRINTRGELRVRGE